MGRNPFRMRPAAELADTILQLHAAESAIRSTLLAVIAAFEAAGSWRNDGAASMTSWLAAQLGVAHGTAADMVTVALLLEELPALAAAFGEGTLSWDKTRALARVATPETERELAERARGLSAAQTERLARCSRAAGDDTTPRSLRMRWDRERQCLYLHGRIPGADGSIVETALERIATRVPADPITGLFESWDKRCADALVELVGSRPATGRDPGLATVVVHVDADTLTATRGLGEVEHGPLVSTQMVHRLACDGRVVADGPDGVPLGIGRTSRKIPAWLNRQIRQRDGGCRFPGCERTRWAHAHHLVHWADGGPTDLDNLALLCHYHHRLVHEGGWQISGSPNQELVFIRPDRRPYQPGPQRLRCEVRERLVEAVVARDRDRPPYDDSS